MSGNSNKVIFSVYKEVKDNSVTSFKKQELSFYKDKLMKRQHEYAQFCNADYFVYENNNEIINEYDSIQFFKIQQLEELAKQYEYVLYLDLDVIPFIFKDFFKCHDLSKICCYQQNGKEWGIERLLDYSINNNGTPAYRKNQIYNHIKFLDPMNTWVKSASKNAMLTLENHKNYNENIINTAVIGGSSESISKINFTKNLNHMIDLITEAKYDNVYPKEIHEYIRPNNEVFFSYLIEKNNVPVENIDIKWNYIIDDYWGGWGRLSKEEYYFLHVINKKFSLLETYYNLFSFHS